MLFHIKSTYFIQRIFSYLNEYRKLNLIKYNKNIQKALNINIFNYIILCDKYTLFDTKNKGKEYLRKYNILLFEGEYLNGKKNGKGKEYYEDSCLKFEGEYLNGKKEGLGKEYYNEGKLSFEGEYKKDKKYNGIIYDRITGKIREIKNGNGYTQELNNYGDLEFESECINTQRNGKGKEYYYDGNLKFEGEYLNDEKNGKGKEYSHIGALIFEGEYFYGKRWNGKIYDKGKNNISELKEGKGFIIENDDFCYVKYEVNYFNGEKNGVGKEFNFFDNRLQYEGEYLNGKKHGRGREYNNVGSLIFDGEYLYGYKRRGKGYVKGYLEFEGEYLLEDKYNGKGYDDKGNIIYELKNGTGKVIEYDDYYSEIRFEGEYLNGKKTGKGKEYDDGDLLFEGEYLYGKRWNGKGKEFDPFNNLIFEGEYINGEKIED